MSKRKAEAEIDSTPKSSKKSRSDEETDERQSKKSPWSIERAAKKAAKKLRREEKKAAKVKRKLEESGLTEEDLEQQALEAAKEKKLKKAKKYDKNKEARKAEKEALKKKSKTEEPPETVPAEDASDSIPISKPTVPETDVEAYLTSKDVKIVDPIEQSNIQPIMNFNQLPNQGETYSSFLKSFKEPTPIQAATWPYLFKNRDVIGVAETGSGKTLAFGMPCIERIRTLPPAERRHVKAVIVSPTRELASQIHEQLEKLAATANIRVVCVYGGVPKDPQRQQMQTAQIVVATPGRLNDLLSEDTTILSKADFVCLDEADRMLDTGFEQDIRKILSAVSEKKSRQTVMFTATWPQSVRDLASTFMNDPVQIYIGNTPTGDLRANVRIEQVVEVMDQRDKEKRLQQLLTQYTKGNKSGDKILVFCLYKKEAARIEGFIRYRGFEVVGIHGDLPQQKRTAALQSFKSGQTTILVATDVAARGLDIPAVKLVINVTFPLTAEDYVHRIGRTGRAGETGKAITFFTENEKPLSGALINVLRSANQPVPEALLKFGTTVKKKEHAVYGAHYRETDGMKKATKIVFD